MNKLVLMLVLVSTVSLYGLGIPYNQEFRVNENTTGFQGMSAITMLNNGGFVITWSRFFDYEPFYDIMAKCYDVNGTVVRPAFNVNPSETEPQCNQAITTLTDGKFVICWTRFVQQGMFNGIYAQIYNQDGSKFGDELHVNTSPDLHHEGSAIAALSNGGFVICWKNLKQNEGAEKVYAQIFKANGHKVGEELQINSFTEGILLKPAVSALNNNGFVVTWESWNSDVSKFNIYARIYDPYGNAIAEEFQVNSTVDNYQLNPDITTLPDGSFVICWSNQELGVTNTNILVQRFAANGIKIGDEFQVNTRTDLYHDYPAITTIANKEYIVCWQSIDPDYDDFDIFAQKYFIDGSKSGDKFSVVSDADSVKQMPMIASVIGGGLLVSWDNSDPEVVGGLVYAKYIVPEPSIQQLLVYNLITPHNDETIYTLNPKFKWQKSIKSQKYNPVDVKYELYLSTDLDFNNQKKIQDLIDTTYTTPKEDSLEAGQTYFWKVLAKNIAGDSLWSSNINAFFVSHNATEVKEGAQLPTGYVLEQNYPNPFNPVTTVRYTLPGSEPVELTLYDITGRQVLQLVNGMQSAGMHTVKIDGSDLASGVYVYTLKAGAFTQSKKMVLVR